MLLSEPSSWAMWVALALLIVVAWRTWTKGRAFARMWSENVRPLRQEARQAQGVARLPDPP